MAYYIDTSGLVKLVVREAETPDLVAWLETHQPQLVSADLSRTELVRATRRIAPERVERARDVLDRLTLLTVTSSNFDAAGLLEPTTVRSLDAVHLAVALDLGQDLEGIITYDQHMAEASIAHGVTVVCPHTETAH